MKKVVLSSLCMGLVAFFALVLCAPTVMAAGEPSGAQRAPDLPKAAASFSDSEWNSLVEQAKKEAKVVIYAGPIGAARPALMDAFREKYGISLDVAMGKGEEMVAKIDNERKAGVYAVDMFIHGMTTYFTSIQPRRITVPIIPLLILPEVTDTSKWRQGKFPIGDKEGHLAVLGFTATPHMIVNTQVVKPGEMASHSDLLDPRWRGKIAINDPSFSGAGAEWFTFVVREMMGVEKGAAFMRELAKQQPAITRDQRLLTEWVARGKYAVALGPDKATTSDFIQAGAPIDYPQNKEPKPTASGPGNLMVFDRAPHPNATRLFLNWLLSREGATVYSKASGFASTRLDVPTDWIHPMQVPGPNDILLGEEYQLAKGEMRKLAAEIFGEQIK
jgi:iron(III) transport system substrate-binding protein